MDDGKVIDTLEISRTLYERDEKHNLNICVERERVRLGKEGFHSADFDVRMTAKVFVSMMGKVDDL